MKLTLIIAASVATTLVGVKAVGMVKKRRDKIKFEAMLGDLCENMGKLFAQAKDAGQEGPIKEKEASA